jgi:hypothetical protein
MTEFKLETRKRCRNPKCKMKLPEPVVNEREAFCCRGCYSSFYLHRCRVCEDPIEQSKGRPRMVCKKAKCQTAWKGREGFGKYAVEHFTSRPSQNGEKSPEKPAIVDLFSATRTTDRTHSTVAAKAPHDFCAVCGSEGLDSGLCDRRVDGGWIAVCADCLPGDEWKACPPEPDDASDPYRPLEPKAPRPWRASAAGRPISVYHCAVVSDAPNGGLPDIRHAAVWANGDWQKTEACNLAKSEKDSGRVLRRTPSQEELREAA